MRKICYALILSILVVSMVSTAHIAVATVAEPIVEPFGTLYKSVDNPPAGYWHYTDSKEVAQELEFYDTIPEENVTVSPFNLGFTDRFTNSTTTGYSQHYAGAAGNKWDKPQIGLYTDSMDIDYILFASSNTSVVLSGDIGESWCMLPSEKNVKSEDHWAVILTKYDYTASWDNIAAWIIAEFIDEGAEDHQIRYKFMTAGSNSYDIGDYDNDGKSDDIDVVRVCANMETTEPTICFSHKLKTFETSLSVTFTKLNATGFGAYYDVPTSPPDPSYHVKYKVRSIQVFPKKLEIENILINETKTQQTITFEADSSWDSTVSIDRAGNVTIPFVSVPVPTYTYHDSELAIEFEHELLLPDETDLLYDSCKVNYTVGDGIASELTINAVDYFSKIKTKDPADEIELLSSISAGELKEVETYVTYTTDEYYELAMQVPVAWYTPRGIADRFLGFFIAILNALGFSGATAKKMRAKVRTPAKR